MNKMPILQSRDIQVRRGGRLILDVSRLDIAAGEVLSVIGPNGAGKTTLLQALSGLLRLGCGEIRFATQKVGTDIAPLVYRRNLAMVFQEALLFDATVYANVAAGLRLRRVKKAEIKKIVTARLEQFGIGHLQDRSAKTLSGGEAQRTSLARAFAINPQILFLDEPFAALDPPTRENLLEDLSRVLRESGTTAVMATHDQGEALRLSDRIAVMHAGRIVQVGTPATVMNHPVDEIVAAFVGVDTILPGRVVKYERGTATVAITANDVNPDLISPAALDKAPVSSPPENKAAAVANPETAGDNPLPEPAAMGTPPSHLSPLLEAVGETKVGEMVFCCIRPEHVTLAPGVRQERSSARNSFAAVITRVIPAGPFYKIYTRGEFPLAAYITTQSLAELDLREGTAVTASFKATAVHIIRRG